MIINIIDSGELFDKSSWSIQLFFPQTEIKINNNYKMIKIKELIKERKDNISLNGMNTNVNYIGLENIESKTARLIGFEPRLGKEIKSTCKRFFYGDILYGRLRPNLNKVLCNDKFEEGVCSTEIFVLIPDVTRVDGVYLSELLRTEIINDKVVKLIKGAALPRVAISDLLELEVPVPELSVQKQLAEQLIKKREELEGHIRRVKQIPQEMDDLITNAYM